MATKDTEVINGAGGEIMLYQPDESVGLYSQDAIQSRIFTIRGVQVMLDRDLAFFYGVETKRINEQIKRNPNRFPEDFVFQLTKEEWECLRSQNGTLENDYKSDGYSDSVRLRSQNATIEKGRGQHTKYLPYVFTEPGVGQLSSVLRSRTADEVSVRIQRAFVLVEELIQKAVRRIVLIDDYVNAGVLQRFHKRNAGVTLDCYVKRRFATQDLRDAVDQYNAQYPGEPTVLHTFERSHDR